MVLKPTMLERQTCIHWWSGAQPSLGELGAPRQFRGLRQPFETIGEKIQFSLFLVVSYFLYFHCLQILLSNN